MLNCLFRPGYLAEHLCLNVALSSTWELDRVQFGPLLGSCFIHVPRGASACPPVFVSVVNPYGDPLPWLGSGSSTCGRLGNIWLIMLPYWAITLAVLLLWFFFFLCFFPLRLSAPHERGCFCCCFLLFLFCLSHAPSACWASANKWRDHAAVEHMGLVGALPAFVPCVSVGHLFVYDASMRPQGTMGLVGAATHARATWWRHSMAQRRGYLSLSITASVLIYRDADDSI